MTYAEIIVKLILSDDPPIIYMDGFQPFVVYKILKAGMKQFVMEGRYNDAHVTYRVAMDDVNEESNFTEFRVS